MIGLRSAVLGLAAVGLLAGIVSAALVTESELTEYRPALAVLGPIVGWSFIAAGAFAWLRRPESRIGALMVATGFAWYASLLASVEAPLLFTIGWLLSNLFAATAIHLLLAFPSGRLSGRWDRLVVRVVYLTVTVGLLPVFLLTDPAALGCPECPENLALIDSQPGFVDFYDKLLTTFGAVLLVGTLVLLAWRWRDSTRPMRRVLAPVYAPGALLLSMLAFLLVFDLAESSEQVFEICFYAMTVAFGLIPIAFIGGLGRTRLLRGGAVARLVGQLGTPLRPGDLRRTLVTALGDPSIEIAYWLPAAAGYVDEDGRPVEMTEPGARRAASEVNLEGRRVAAILHDPSLLEDRAMVDAVGAAAALALERERLDAELRAKVDELRESRSRVIGIGLAERRRLERDLHDGAQQRLVSLALDLRLAKDKLRDDPAEAEKLLDDASGELMAALTELRELARGIHPAVLSDRGLGPAIENLVGRVPIPVEVQAPNGERAPEQAELAAYYVVAEALTNVVKYSGATHASVSVEPLGGELRVEVADDGVGGADPSRGSGLDGLSERVGVLGGRLDIDSPPARGTRVRAVIPCE